MMVWDPNAGDDLGSYAPLAGVTGSPLPGAVQLLVAAAAAANGGGSEPTYTPAIHTLVFPLPGTSTQYPMGFPPGNSTALLNVEDFSLYANTAAVTAQYPNSQTDGTLALDTTTGVSSGKSLRFDWANGGDLGAGDANVHIEHRTGKLTDGVHQDFPNYSATARHQIFSCWTKYSTGFHYISAHPRGAGQKTVIFFRDPNGTHNKATFIAVTQNGRPHPIAADVAITGLEWDYDWDSNNQEGHVPAAGPPTWAQSGTTGGVQIGTSVLPQNVADNTWRHLTIEVVKESGDLTGDGIIRVWYGGVLVMNHDGTDPSNAAYQIGYTGDGLGWADPFWIFGILNSGADQAQSSWATDIQLYYVTGS
jgi:hypothetical protein